MDATGAATKVSSPDLTTNPGVADFVAAALIGLGGAETEKAERTAALPAIRPANTTATIRPFMSHESHGTHSSHRQNDVSYKLSEIVRYFPFAARKRLVAAHPDKHEAEAGSQQNHAASGRNRHDMTFFFVYLDRAGFHDRFGLGVADLAERQGCRTQYRQDNADQDHSTHNAAPLDAEKERAGCGRCSASPQTGRAA
jgi:hypothetical protein